MRPVAPRVGLPEVTLAEDQHEYLALTACPVIFSDGTSAMLTRWRLDDAERAKIAAGEDLYLCALTFGGPVQPVALTVGAPEWAPGEES